MNHRLAGRTVLGVFAHPDDETFGPGGTLARLAAEGADVHLLTATRGESGTIGPSGGLGRLRLAAIRERELVDACAVLGIRPPVFLYLPDYGLGRLEEETLLRPIVRVVREVRPDTLLVFHSNGISGHLDHRTVTERTLTAFARAADPDFAPELGTPHPAARMWGYCIPESRTRKITWRRVHGVPDAEVDAEIDTREFLKAKREAVNAHATQRAFIDDMEARLGGLEGIWSSEGFVLMAARAPLPAGAPHPVDDLFLGMPGGAG